MIFYTNIGPKLAREITINEKSLESYLQKPIENIFFEVDEAMVYNCLQYIILNCGQGGLSSVLMKHILILTQIINQTLKSGIFLGKLSIAKVIPHYKIR